MNSGRSTWVSDQRPLGASPTRLPMAPERLLILARQLGSSVPPGPEAMVEFGAAATADALAELGVETRASPTGALALARPVDWLDAAVVARCLGNQAEPFQVSVVDCVGSTNTELLRAAALGAPHGAVLAAELQAAGRGRGGRRWEGGIGSSLVFSVLWRFHGQPFFETLALVVGVAVIRALASAGVRDAGLKWPNDLLLEGAKAGGVLVESRSSGAALDFAVIGIGLNVGADPRRGLRAGRVGADLRASGFQGSRSELLACLLLHLRRTLAQHEAEGFEGLRQEWERAHVHRGQWVTLHVPDGSLVEGRALGISARGDLQLETAQGTRSFRSGEVSSQATFATTGGPL